MASVITRSAHPDALWPGVLKWFGLNYEEFPDIWEESFDRIEGELATERLIEATGFGLAQTKTESAPIQYDSDSEGYATLATPNVVALGYQVTREELEDNLYTEVSLPRAESLAFSMHTTIELIHANIFIFGFTNSAPYLFGDGQPLFSASHPTKSGNQSNLGTTSADLSEASLEDMIKRIYLAQNSRGLPISLRPRKLVQRPTDLRGPASWCSWLDMDLALLDAYDHDAEIVVLRDLAGAITEGPGFNVFAYVDGRWLTPGSGTLQGITRRSVIELAALGLQAVDQDRLTAFDLSRAQEVFITSTAGGIMPVTIIDGEPVGAGLAGTTDGTPAGPLLGQSRRTRNIQPQSATTTSNNGRHAGGLGVQS